MADDVLYALEDGGVAVLTLNRPERLNAWTAISNGSSSTTSTSAPKIPT